MRICIILGEGIGNQIEQLPTIKILFKKYPKATFDILNSVHHCFWFTEYLYKNHPRIDNIYSPKTLPKDYKADAKFVMPYVKDRNITFKENLTQPTFNHIERIYHSEIKTNLRAINALDAGDEFYDVREFFPENLDAPVPKYELVLHNGCNKNCSIKNLWNVKLYPHFEELVERLKSDYTICSIGSPDEYIPGTINETGKCIEKSIELIRKSRLFISNDTGTFHIAAALKKKGIVIFSATSPWKNYDTKFHKSIELVRRTDLDCSPCQKKGNGYWMKHCKLKEACKNISVGNIIPLIKRLATPKRKPGSPEISIITRVYNRLEYTIHNVKNIHDLIGLENYEHIIIDQGSTDGTPEWLKSIESENYYKIRVKYNKENTGDAGGMKDGFNMISSHSKYIMQFDGDCEPLTNGFAKTMKDLMDKHDDIGILMMFREGVVNNIKPKAMHIIDGHLLGEIPKATCCFMIRRDLLEEINIWKTKEDIGWGFAISEAVLKNKLRILKTMNIKINHIDGTVMQAIKYNQYHNSRDSNKTNYRDITY